ncbi:MAG: hypothetical protein JO247_16735, partial [Chloroflexi bacterium]|nr:hypothetical protein [Chloroflexota bacterium]
MEIGHFRIDPVSDGVGFFDPGAFKGSTPEMWANHRQFLTDDGKIELALGGFLIRGAN